MCYALNLLRKRPNLLFASRFGDLDYAFEALVAEIDAALFGAHAGIPFETMSIQSVYWLQILQGDSRAIFTAVARAQQAADFVLDKAGIAGAPEEVHAIIELPVAA